jgi:hypothetical protein
LMRGRIKALANKLDICNRVCQNFFTY